MLLAQQRRIRFSAYSAVTHYSCASEATTCDPSWRRDLHSTAGQPGLESVLLPAEQLLAEPYLKLYGWPLHRHAAISAPRYSDIGPGPRHASIDGPASRGLAKLHSGCGPGALGGPRHHEAWMSCVSHMTHASPCQGAEP